MSEPQGSPFRAEAYARYVSEKKRTALPRLVKPSTFRILWVLASILLAAGALAWWTEVPVFAAGTAIAIADEVTGARDNALLVLMPPECAELWHRGDKLAVRLPGSSEWCEAELSATEPTPLGPIAIEERYRLRGAAAATLDRPRAIAIATLSPRAAPSARATNAAAGTILEARVEIGRRRALSLLSSNSGGLEDLR